MFFPNNGGFWRNQEQANQFVHMFFGFWAVYVLNIFGCGYWSLFGGFIPAGISLFIQLVFEDPEKNTMFILDKIRDTAFYLIGGSLILIIIKFPVK